MPIADKHNIKITVLTSLYRCELFLERYLQALSLIEGKEITEVLLLHNAPTETETKIINAYLPQMEFVQHIIIPEREPLYKTWNRGISLSKGEYITIWNVDDVRFSSSIVQQAEALDRNPQAAIAYGDIWLSNEYGVEGTKRTYSPRDNSKKDFFNAYHISCFQMWRKSIHDTIGYYDEQFKCVADFDFQIRAAIHFSFVKTEQLLGIYLEDQPHKLSSNGLQRLENNIVHLRYGAYQRLYLFDLRAAKKKYRQNEMMFFDKWYPLDEKAQFGLGYKIKGSIIAFFDSLLLASKSIVKRIIYATKRN